MAPVWGAGQARRVRGVGPPAPLRGGRGAGSLGTAAGGGGGPEALAEDEKQGAPFEPSCHPAQPVHGFQFQSGLALQPWARPLGHSSGWGGWARGQGGWRDEGT